MKKQERTRQLMVRTFVVGCVLGGVIGYGINHIELPKSQLKQKCEWEQCNCIDWRGMPLDTKYHCALHGHACME